LKIQCLSTGLIYRNPKPHVRSVHAYFPSVVTLPGGEMLAAFALAEAFEAADMHTCLARSRDGGETWQFEGRMTPGTSDRLTSESVRLAVLPDGEIVAAMVRCDRTDHPGEGLTNPATLGFVPNEFLLLRSRDRGRTWSDPEPLDPPLVGPCFENCSPVRPLATGRWLLPTSTWRGWDGECPNGMKAVAFVSHDRGKSWPECVDVFDGSARGVIHWEGKIVELGDGRLAAAAWAYDERAARDLPNQYTVSSDGGRTWAPPRSTGLQGQTMTIFALSGRRILAIYRRMDTPGLWANVASLEGEEWVNEAEAPLWGAGAAGLTGASANMARNFQVLRFGAPCLTAAPDGHLFAAIWCVEECVSNIRWFRIRVAD
jgi:hypothetical protein